MKFKRVFACILLSLSCFLLLSLYFIALLARILMQMMFVIRKTEIGSYLCLNICRFLCKDAVHLPVLIEDSDGSLIPCTELEPLPTSMVQIQQKTEDWYG